MVRNGSLHRIRPESRRHRRWSASASDHRVEAAVGDPDGAVRKRVAFVMGDDDRGRAAAGHLGADQLHHLRAEGGVGVLMSVRRTGRVRVRSSTLGRRGRVGRRVGGLLVVLGCRSHRRRARFSLAVRNGTRFTDWHTSSTVHRRPRRRRVTRSEIWTAAADSGYAGRPRPVVIIQDDLFDATASVTVCAFTTDDTDAPCFQYRSTQTRRPESANRLVLRARPTTQTAGRPVMERSPPIRAVREISGHSGPRHIMHATQH